MKLSNRYNLPEPLVNAIKNDPYDAASNDTGDISTTRLIAPIQQVVLSKRHDDTLEEDVSSRIWAFFGQGCHTALERAAGLNTLTEKRFGVDILGWRLTGQIDMLDKDGVLWDYKVTSSYAVAGKPKDEWVKQQNVNRYLLEQNGVPVKEMKILALLKDWNARSKLETPVAVIEIPHMENVRKYIEERVLMYQNAYKLEDGDLPKCSESERWISKTGVSRRCVKYCAAKSVCHQVLNLKVK